MKKVIALLLCAILLLGLLAACGKEDETGGNGTTPQGNAGEVTETEKAGTIVVTANASVAISYGTDGLVLKVEGLNKDGENLMESYDELLGSSCAEVVNRIIKDCAGRTYMGRLSYVAVKQEKDSGNPGTNFWQGIESAAKNAVEGLGAETKLVLITQEMLDADGNIDLATAKALVEGYLQVDALDGIDGTSKPVDGFYSFQVSYDGLEAEVNVNATTGAVGDGVVGDVLQEPEQTEPEVTEPEASDPTMSESVPSEEVETPEQTQAVEGAA